MFPAGAESRSIDATAVMPFSAAIAAGAAGPAKRGSGALRIGLRISAVAVVLLGLFVGLMTRTDNQAGALTTEPGTATLGSEPTDPAPQPEPSEPELSEPSEPSEPELQAEPSEPSIDSERVLEAISRTVGEDLAEAEVVMEKRPADRPGDVIYLTFDDGPHPDYTPRILDILARYDANATFFVLGSLVERHPELFQRIIDEGHTVANHSWNHTDLADLSQADFNDSVGRTQDALGRHATPCLRPPYGSLGSNTRSWAAELDLEIVLWDVDTLDWQGPGAGPIAERVVNGAFDGAIVLLHDGGGDRTETVAGLELAMAELDRRGYTFEPIC